MIYHPSLVRQLSEEDAHMVLDSLVRLVTTTRMKAICNLSVWCISIQQFDALVIDCHLHSLLRAVSHAMDNPFGSLSTTYEATQAMVKLTTQLCGKMREMASIWTPPIYRRLVSIDRKERDMSERCLLKTESAFAVDLKKNLLARLMDMLQDRCQVLHTIQAWKWYIRLLGPDALKRRHLVNEMLKIPQKTFSDPDHQAQMATMVAWESLIETLIPSQIGVLDVDKLQVLEIQQAGHGSLLGDSKIIKDGCLKRIKLLMDPLIGVISSRRRELSILSCCMNTWYYLLHKLDVFVNHPSVLQIVLEPVLETVFSVGPSNQNTWLWDTCLDLLDEFILSKPMDRENGLNSDQSPEINCPRLPSDGKVTLKSYPNKWLAWEVGQVSYFLKMVNKLTCQVFTVNANPESRVLALNAALRIFTSVLKGVQLAMKKPSYHYHSYHICISTILKFVKGLCEDATSLPNGVHCDILCIILQFVEAIKIELEPSMLASPLYRVVLDINYVSELQSAKQIEYLKFPGATCFAYMDMVSPMLYLNVLYFCTVAQSISESSKTERILHAVGRSNFLSFSCNSLLDLHSVICLLYMHGWKPVPDWINLLKMWIVVAEKLKGHIDTLNDLPFFRTEELGNAGYGLMHQFLCYPVSICLPLENYLAPVKLDNGLLRSEKEFEYDSVFELWKYLLDSSIHALQFESSAVVSFAEGLCKVLFEILDDNIPLFQGSMVSDLHGNLQDDFILEVFSEVASCILEQVQYSQNTTLTSKISDQDGSCSKKHRLIETSMAFVSRIIWLSLAFAKANPQVENMIIGRIFGSLARTLACLCSKEDIELVVEKISDPLAYCLSSGPSTYDETHQGIILREFQLLWTQILESLQRSKPAIIFDSNLLRVQAPLLQETLDHPHSSISDVTVAFWRDTYGKKCNLHYPQYLVPVLGKLCKKGVISFIKEIPQSMEEKTYTRETMHAPEKRSPAFSTQKWISKRTEVIEGTWNDFGFVNVESLGLRSKRLKLLEQPGVANEAHNGKKEDGCASHLDTDSPSVFKKQNQEVRKPECILEMLRRGRGK